MTIIVSDRKPEKKIVSGEPRPEELFGSRVGLITPVKIGIPGDIGTPVVIRPRGGFIDPFLNNYREQFE